MTRGMTSTTSSLLTRAPRVLGALTVAYSAVVLASPRTLAAPAGLTSDSGFVSPSVATAVRGLALRDVASGAAMVVARRGTPLRTAIGVRVASDLGDAALFAVAAPDAATRAKAVAVALGWGALCAASARVAG
ncbi:hypothetical protein ACTHQY_03885 [Rhodococcoides corynebacterioides]|uniref:hypothetical protein n=1 Tax=Rhodococcoides corynebacterioides TaxID=53972 RepID=UPI003F7F8372